MEVLTIEGKDYVKASVLARELGYTNDYVGQLCRAEKVTAQRVGRNWYVDPDSLRAHKKTRYQKTTATNTSNQTSSTHVSVDEKEHDSNTHVVNIRTASQSTHTSHSKSFYAHAPAAAKSRIHYEEDGSELLPQPVKREVKKELEVDLADAKDVAIKSKATDYALEATEQPKVRFHGELDVTDVDDEVSTSESEGGVAQKETSGEAKESPNAGEKQKEDTSVKAKTASDNPPKKAVKTNEITSKIRVKVNNRRRKHVPVGAVHEVNSEGVVAMQRVHTGKRAAIGGTIAVPASDTSTSTSFLYLVPLMIIAALLLVMGLLSMQSRVTFSSGQTAETYTFSLHTMVTLWHLTKVFFLSHFPSF